MSVCNPTNAVGYSDGFLHILQINKHKHKCLQSNKCRWTFWRIFKPTAAQETQAEASTIQQISLDFLTAL